MPSFALSRLMQRLVDAPLCALGLILLCGTGGDVWADEAAVEKGIAAQQKPVVSELGRRRIQENLRIVVQSLTDIEQNLEASEHNVRTIQKEISELKQLEKEHQQLRKKYTEYLTFARSEFKKNTRSERELAAWERKQLKAAEKLEGNEKQKALEAAKSRIEEARRQRVDRNLWKVDAEKKIKQVEELLGGLDKNLAEIRARRDPLQEQLDAWKARYQEYEQLLQQTRQKKGQLEAFLGKTEGQTQKN